MSRKVLSPRHHNVKNIKESQIHHNIKTTDSWDKITMNSLHVLLGDPES